MRTRIASILFAIVTLSALPVVPTGSPAETPPACTIEHVRWGYIVNEYAQHGGYLTFDGVLSNYHGKRRIYVTFYNGYRGGKRGSYLGNDWTVIDPTGTFNFMLDSRRPSNGLSYSYACR